MIDLDCGIAMARIEEWLDGELGLPISDAGWTFPTDGGSCQVRLEPLANRRLGQVQLERTRLVGEGDADALEAFYKLFTLRFLSAGG